MNVSKSSDPERVNNICVAKSVVRISLVQQLITNLNVILYTFVNMPHRIHECTNTLYDYAIINY